jgi:hypothetical protein
MKLLRHILSHLFFLSFVLLLVSAYYYRSLILPPDYNQNVDNYVEQLYPPALKFTSGRDYFWASRINNEPQPELLIADTVKTEVQIEDISITAPSVVAVPDAVVVNASKTVQPEPKKDLKLSEKNQIINADVPEPEVVQTSPQAQEQVMAANESSDTQTDSVRTEDMIAAENNKTEVNSTHTEIAAIKTIAKSEGVSDKQLLIDARTAFNSGNVTLSEKYYLELTARTKSDPDVFGELGNVYYSQGKWKKAGEAYYEAAVRLIDTGRRDQVVYLQRVIQGLDAGYAEKLAQIINN